jgi:hypothetical protein
MSIVSLFKRKCDKEIGGCGKKNVDKDRVISVIKGKKHLCITCAGGQLAEVWISRGVYNKDGSRIMGYND